MAVHSIIRNNEQFFFNKNSNEYDMEIPQS